MTGFFIFIFLAAVMLFIGWLAGRKQTDAGYNIYDRKLPLLLYVSSYAATQMGAGFFLLGTAMAYKYGTGLLWVIVGYAIGAFVFGHYSSWIKRRVGNRKFHTLADYCTFAFGKRAGSLVAWTGFVLLVGDLAVQLIGGGKVLEQLGVAPFYASIILTTIVIGTYLMWSGFRAVVWTDVVLLVSMIALTLVVSFSAYQRIATTAVPSAAAAPIGIVIGFFIYGLLLPFSSSTYFQRIFAGKNEHTARVGTWLSFFLVAIPIIGLLLIGTAARLLNPGLDPDLAFLNVIAAGSAPLLYGGAVLLWAALMSTADTTAFGASQILMLNLRGKPHVGVNARWSLVFVLGCALLITALLPSIFGIGILFLGGGMTLATPMLLHWFVRISERVFVWSIITSLVASALYVVFVAWDPSVAGVAVAVSLASIGVGSALERWARA